MLQKIHIQNFRCFEDFKAEGFERVNLIGGKNNSGKTCLLEGILCLNPIVILTNASHSVYKETKRVWDIRNQQPKDLLNANSNKESISIATLFPPNSYDTEIRIINNNVSLNGYGFKNIFYISQRTSCPSIDFDKLIYKIEKEDRLDEFVKIFQKVDPSIKTLRTIGGDGPTPQLKQTFNTKYLYITSFGDAINSLLKYFAPIIERLVFEEKKENDFILLIDEIENGIHYTAHEEFWQHLFKLCKELNVQVFATTHSLEMIKAFNAVALKEGEGAYFEMVRDVNSNEIFAQKRDAEQLEYAIETEKTFRGE